jgi:SAM-dependent methyltransferase
VISAFTCNICGTRGRTSREQLGRELASCEVCGSSVRTRALIHALCLELFGIPLALADFPRVKSLRGMGLSDPNQFAEGLARKFDYRNTFYDREPRFDIARPPEEEFGKYDFLISSEVFEHVPPPAEAPFRNAFRLLKPDGVLLLTVPYSLEPASKEHFPDLDQFGLARVGERLLLVNRTREGQVQVFDDLVFHTGWGEPSLEMRQFTESGLKEMLMATGFAQIRFCSEDYAPFGVVHAEAWSLPVAARKGQFALSADAIRDVVREWRDLKLKFDAEMKRLDRAFWFRLGRKLGFLA